jgi:hypothetical protein
VEGLDRAVEPLEEVHAFDERALPSPFEVEMEIGFVVEVEGHGARLDAEECRPAARA